VAARKVLHIAWAVATKGQPFDPHYHEQRAQVTTTPTEPVVQAREARSTVVEATILAP
jgi:hypothetical protein